ncbi:MAG: 1,4-alpha-glucan branching protein domain-containing protein [Candidatus Firestonebacteria bacterium]
MEKGYLSLVLHAHLPYVRHPEYESFLEEDWFYEAIIETYIPFINLFDKLALDGVDWRLTMSITPPLANMLIDPLLQERTVKHIERLIELAEKEVIRTQWQSEFNTTAKMYLDKFKNARYVFVETYGKNLINAFKKHQDSGKLEIITCAATHGYLPLMEVIPNAVRAQISIAVTSYTRLFGRKPRGIWLPECAYYPGLDAILKEFGIKFFILDTHGILYGSPRPKYGIFAPVYCPTKVAAFGRDLESSKQVWSSKEGYPGDYYYRDFYRDIGFDMDYEYIKPYIHKDGIRVYTGIKYYRITGNTDYKEPYNPHIAFEKAASHAGNFLFNREKQVEYLAGIMDRKPMILAPYDAELFGHWWYEGPEWLNFLIRKIYYDQKTIKLITPYEYLQMYPKNQISMPSASSWGWKGYHEVWLNGANDWVYRHLHKTAQRMVELANSYRNTSGVLHRALNQAARELLLAQSSDWAFLMKTGTASEYATKRTIEHIARFVRLYENIKNNSIDERWLSDIEYKDNIFPEISYEVYRG